MTKIHFFQAILFISLSAFSQNTITLKGKLIDQKSQLALESATVYLSTAKDSSVVDYTITDKNGLFKITTKKISKPIFLKISYIGYQTYKQELKEISEDKNFGNLELITNSNTLGEVVIKSEAPPIRIKKDTLEFNVSSFKVRPDANVETLLKQLPGVEIDTDGKITVNGKEVNQILVNGKPFFDKDGKIALQNLPSDIIKKVQITDTKTKKEELSKLASTSNNASINLTIDEKKNKGFFGKFMAGKGSDNRYESSALINYFNNKRKISVLASSNNINSTGFSMDEVFDNMGGGRNNSSYYNSDGSYGIGNMRFGGGKGITKFNMVGLNYSDELIKDFQSTGSYFFTESNTENTNRTLSTNFLPTGNFSTNSYSKSNEDRLGNNMNFEFEYAIDSTAKIIFIPKFSNSNNKYQAHSSEASTNNANQLLNESSSDTYDDSEKNNFSNAIDFNKTFKRKGRMMSLSLNNQNSNDNNNSFNNSSTVFYQTGEPDDIRNQNNKSQNKKDSYSAEFEFTEPIKDSISIRLAINYNLDKIIEDRKTFDFESVSQTYSIQNDLLTNFQTSNIKTITPKLGFSINKEKFNFNSTIGPSFTQFDNHSLYMSNNLNLNNSYILPSLNSSYNYKFTKSKSFWISYNYEIDFPSASKILPIENLTNPLNIFIGNQNLNPDKNHNFYMSFRDFDYATRSGYSFYGGGDYYDNQVVSSSIYDDNRKRITTYENISGTYSFWYGANWNKTIKREANTFKFGFGMNGSVGLSKGFSNTIQYESNNLRFTPRANFTYEYGELFTINPSYNLTHTDSKYTNYTIKAASNVLHKFNIQTTNYLPSNWVIGNDFGYNYNSNIADGFKKDFYLWNTSISYSFFSKKITTKVKVYDILNQNQSETRMITPTTIRDEQNSVLKRYVMFSLTYKLDKFAGKDKSSEGRRMIMY
jgi:hypothetical protein